MRQVRTIRTVLPVACAALGAFVALGSPASAQEEPQDAIISVDVQVVNLLATVRDKKGVLIDSLTKNDFELYEDGVPQDVKYFSRQSDLSLTVGLLVDTSVSQQRLIQIQRQAGFKFFDKIIRKDKDLAFLMSFDVDVELLQDLTASTSLLSEGLQLLEVQGAARGVTPGPVPTSGRPVGTAMYDSVFLAADEMLKPQVGRKALVLISDGNDYGSRIDAKEAIDAALKADVIIFSVRYFDREFYFRAGAAGGGGSGALRKLARETGGDVFEVGRKQSLDSILDEINRTIRNQYSLGYTPKRDLSVEGFRKIELRVKRKGYKVQARKGYYPEAL